MIDMAKLAHTAQEFSSASSSLEALSPPSSPTPFESEVPPTPRIMGYVAEVRQDFW